MAAVIEDDRGEERAALATFERAASRAEQTVLGGYIGDIAARFAASIHAREGRVPEAEAELARAAGPGLGWDAGDAELTRAMVAVPRGWSKAASGAGRAA